MPRTLAQNAQYINETIKPAIKSAIEAQGVTVPSTDSFLDYADRIGEIEGGGSGYQLKDLPTGVISTVTDAAELPLNALKVGVEAVQSGSGTPSPSNIRPISGWDSGEITVCDDVQNPTQTETTTLNFPQTIYGAEWDVVSGKLKQTDGYIASYNGESLPSSWISDRDVYDGTNTPTIGAEVVYKLATPTTIDLSPLSIRMLQGTNNIYADCGEVIEGEYFSGSAKGYVDGIKYANEGDGGIASYTNIKSADELTGATAITFEVYARIDSYVNKTSGAYARIMEFGDSQQSGRLGFLGLASDASNNLCYWDDSADIASGIDTWTLGDTHLVSVVKTTAGVLKIYVDGVLKYTGTSTLTITTSIIDYIAERGGYSSAVDNARRLNGEIYAWRIYAKELSAANIAQNLTADRSLYAR